MALDPQVKAFLDQMKAAGGPKMQDAGPVAGREMFAGLMQMVGPKDVPVGKTENRMIPGVGGVQVPIRITTPVAAGGEPLPALVHFHGGGFVIGSVDTHDGLCRLMANEGGFRVISVDYRLAPEHKYPAAIDDAFAALTWIAENAADIGVDANRIAVGGDSAGGALAAEVAQLAKAKGISIDAQLLMFPVTQIGAETRSLKEFAVGYFLERDTLEWFYKCYLPEGADTSDPRISPLRAKDLSGLPPAYIMLGGFDPLHDEGMEYADKLRAAGVKVTVAEYEGMVHTFTYLQSVLPQAHEALAKASKAIAGMFTK
jgi:acetyl esterase